MVCCAGYQGEIMKQLIIVILSCIVAAGPLWADEIVLEDGKVLCGNVLDLTENTVSIEIDDKKIVINREEVEAVFLGENNPFSSKGYPGLQANKVYSSPDVKKDEKKQ